MSSPLSDLSEPPGSPEPLALPLSVPSEVRLPTTQEEPTELVISEAQEAIEDRSESAPSVQAIQLVDVDDTRQYFTQPTRSTFLEVAEDEVTILEERSTVRNDPLDTNQEPQRIQNGNIVEVRWTGTGESGDLIIEVDENGYEIPKSDELVAAELQDATSHGQTDDDLWDDGERGARSLLDHCRGIVMRLQPRYDDIGDLQYQQHPLFFKTMSAKQLEEIESHSPAIKPDTDHLWKQFVMQKSLPDYKTYDQNPPKSWRRVYKHLLREEQRKILQAAEDMKAFYAAEEMEKRAKRTQMTTTSLQDLGYRKKAASAGSSRAKQTTLLGKVREKTIQDRKFRAPPSLPTPRAATLESLIFPTSGPYATLGAFHPSAASKITGSKTTKVSALPAPPFVFPSHDLRAQIRQATGPSKDASSSAIPANGTVGERPRLLKRRLDDESDSDEVTFVAASSSKGKSPLVAQPTVSTFRSPTSPVIKDRKGKRPVDMDFFSVPSASVASSRQNPRKGSTPTSSIIQAADNVVAEKPTQMSSRSNLSERISRPALGDCGTSLTTAIPVPHTLEGSRSRRDPALFVPKRRKVH
ncbi:hypothetical protein NliqN6_1680 [Naganishia liquefaciens]|uniref:Uncharacterized protein n=1 Tax=Naganishia liquefaciens TaxID=104408 RepID=A0A8H3TQZ2_9TREE|nr:hypothetical protein NliqN6_1680 [Naganishia liquefaciens]